MIKINPKKLTVATGKDPHRYPAVSAKIEEKAMDVFKLQQNKMIVDITKQLTQIIKTK